MITINNKNTKKSILVVTHPECEYCKEYSKSEYCQNIPLTKKIVLYPKDDTFFEEEKLKLVFRADEPKTYFKAIMSDRKYNNINYSKDVTKQWNENQNMIKLIEDKFGKIKYTPTIFLLSEDNILEKEIIVDVDFTKLIYAEVSKYNENK